MCFFQIYSSPSSPIENWWVWVEYFKLWAKVLEHRRATLSGCTEATNPICRLCMTVTACLKLYGNSRNSKEGGAVAQWLSEVLSSIPRTFVAGGRHRKRGGNVFLVYGHNSVRKTSVRWSVCAFVRAACGSPELLKLLALRETLSGCWGSINWLWENREENR